MHLSLAEYTNVHRALSCRDEVIISFKPVNLKVPQTHCAVPFFFSKEMVSHSLCLICFHQIRAQKCHSTLTNLQSSLVEYFNSQSPWSPGMVAKSRKPWAKCMDISDNVTVCPPLYILLNFPHTLNQASHLHLESIENFTPEDKMK